MTGMDIRAAARAGRLLRHPRRVRVHRHLPDPRGGLDLPARELLRAGQADLAPFFNFHPWLYLFLIPALSMRLWAEERKSGTIELLLTLPISPAGAVVGKFLAAWLFAGDRARADRPALGHRQPCWATPTTGRSSPATSAAC
jgi:hypothetical protein